MQIQNVNVGLPAQVGTELYIRVMSFDLNATTASLYWEVRSATGAMLINGNYALTAPQFVQRTANITATEDILLAYLGLTRHP